MSNFRSVNKRKADIKNPQFDITGIVGATCAHGVPMLFVNIPSGGEK